MTTKTFDPNQLTVTIVAPVVGINHIVSGFAKDTFINIVRDEDAYNDETDSNSNLIRYKTNNKNAMLTLSLNQASPSNSILSTLMAADDNVAGSGAFGIVIRDNNGDSLITGSFCYVKNFGNIAFGTSGNNRDWSIRVGNGDAFIGGIK